MPDPRLITTADKLLSLTREDKLRWQSLPRPEDADDEWQPHAFSASLAKGSVVISSRHPEGRYPYELHARDPHGIEMGAIESDDDAESWLGDREPEPWEETLHDLYAAARESAVASNASLDALIAELEQR